MLNDRNLIKFVELIAEARKQGEDTVDDSEVMDVIDRYIPAFYEEKVVPLMAITNHKFCEYKIFQHFEINDEVHPLLEKLREPRNYLRERTAWMFSNPIRAGIATFLIELSIIWKWFEIIVEIVKLAAKENSS